MRSFLRNIRSKPKAVRNQYALGISAVFTGLVALVWVVTGMSLDSQTRDDVESGERAPFANLTEQIKEQWAAARGSMNTALSTTTEAVVEDPLTLTITPETKAEIANETTEWTASSTATTTPEYIIVQIATTSQASGTVGSSHPTSTIPEAAP